MGQGVGGAVQRQRTESRPSLELWRGRVCCSSCDAVRVASRFPLPLRCGLWWSPVTALSCLSSCPALPWLVCPYCQLVCFHFLCEADRVAPFCVTPLPSHLLYRRWVSFSCCCSCLPQY